MPPVTPVGSLSRIVALQASVIPVFCTLRVNRPNCPRFIVVGPPLVRVRAGGVGATTWIETLPEALCGGLFPGTTPGMVTILLVASGLPRVAGEGRANVPPSRSGPRVDAACLGETLSWTLR